MRRFCLWIAVLLNALVLLAALPAAAQAPTHIKAELIAESRSVAPGGTVTLAIRMTPQAGWHGYWLNPGDAGLGIELALEDARMKPLFSLGMLQYPVPQTLVVRGLMNHVYEAEYVVLVPLRVDARASGAFPLAFNARWLACTDKICVPESARLVLSPGITIKPATNPAEDRDMRFDGWRAALPAPLGTPATFAIDGNRLRIAVPLPASVAIDQPHLFVADEYQVKYAAPQRFLRDGNLLVVELERAKDAPPLAALGAVLRLAKGPDGLAITAAPGPVPAGGTPLSQGPSLGWLLLSALLGGLLLNVMPCVFPILSLKALSLARAGESETQARAEGLAYTAGVMLACLALGALLLALRAGGEQVGWAFQLQEPLVVAALLLLAVTITANLAGLFEFSVPGFASEGSPQGAFATGLLAAFVATPCTGPFMAAAMGAALLLPVAQAMALFAALGLGLALPFLALAFVPALRRRLPRPGAWMARFKLAMAVPMGLTALALIWLAWRVGGQWFVAALLFVAFGVLIQLTRIGLAQRLGRELGKWQWAAFIALGLLFCLLLPATINPPRQSESSILSAQPFSESALASGRASGKPVFLYFTADWCLTCKVNEAAAIEREETRAAFEKADVVVLRGDWTRRDPAITRFLTAQGAAGVPLYIWYPAGGGAGQQLPQVLTPALLAELATKTRTD
ncbi:thioredoxin family protein [Novosphingobium sp.]|uniref:protein-disulfide reductase DsbD family protein n=1 Tax=Novosphingobium sp. TaxID=1874826 RepID=UPI00286D44AE|nr:thioredoxin family protein [Novosphingobium sp.]